MHEETARNARSEVCILEDCATHYNSRKLSHTHRYLAHKWTHTIHTLAHAISDCVNEKTTTFFSIILLADITRANDDDHQKNKPSTIAHTWPNERITRSGRLLVCVCSLEVNEAIQCDLYVPKRRRNAVLLQFGFKHLYLLLLVQ